MSNQEKTTNGARPNSDGIPLQRVEGLILIMDTPKGALQEYPAYYFPVLSSTTPLINVENGANK